MSDFTDTSYYDGTYQAAAEHEVSTGDFTQSSDVYWDQSLEASDASWDAWGASLEADSYATEAYFAGDTEAQDYWTSTSAGYEADSYAADGASWTADSASDWAYAAETEAYDASYDASASYDSGDAGYY